jgi:exopolysaccharide biosynthesis polyprenyl glycosylphosphotransferase
MLLTTDLATIAAAFVLAHVIYSSNIPTSPHHAKIMYALLAPLFAGMALLNRAYNSEALESSRISVSRATLSLVYAAGAILFITYFLKAGAELSRGVFALGLAGSMMLVPMGRFFLHQPLLAMLGGSPDTTIIVRDGVCYDPDPGDTVVDTADLGFHIETSDPAHFHALARITRHADRVIVATSPERQVEWSSILKSLTVDGEIIVNGNHLDGVISIGEHAGRKTLIVTTGPMRMQDRILKRMLDLSIVIPACLILAPLMFFIAIVIKLESKGPVLFKQDRIGRDNHIFAVYKFRSMYTFMCDTAAVQLTQRSDPRVTRIGSFIRRTSVDELPQLFNILRGDMSVVGPRPHALSAKAADKLYWDVDPRYRHRHIIKPGLTGLAQVRGYRGNTERYEDLTNRLNADLEYAARWSLAGDIQIILKTLSVLMHRNAY